VDGRDGRTITCSRIGCDTPAAASFSFDALSELAWLDTVVESRGAGFLCEHHAERLTPPRGWSLLDRRSPEAKLFVAPSVLPSATSAEPKRERAPKRTRAAKARHAKVVAAESAESAESATKSAPTAATSEGELPFDAPPPMPRTWSPRDLPALDDEFDERTPMLARAFESLRQHEERRPAAATGPETRPEIRPDPGVA
jgi:hypothetical protein